MRAQVVEILIRNLLRLQLPIKRVAIVGGSSREPELVSLYQHFIDLEVKYFGVENNEVGIKFVFFDLNEKQDVREDFDLVICAQVIEHVWDIENAIMNLSKLTKKEHGLLWINCPASNMVHGSPEYFTAGYSPQMLKNHIEKLELETIDFGCIGSRRLYFYTHALRYWPSDFEIRHPLLSYRPLRSYGRRFISETILNFLGRAYSLFLSKKASGDLIFATETYILAKSTFQQN
jgi:SAM-dependent methyltransferase